MALTRLSDHALATLSSGDPLPDHEFDVILPARHQEISETQWSSIAVAREIARLLQAHARAPLRFIDIGCGPGKLCLLMALMTEHLISGIELRGELAMIAREICETNAPGRVTIIHGTMMDLRWDDYDVFYLFNPFDENNFAPRDQGLIDRVIPLNRKSYAKYIDEVFRQLVFLAPGKLVLTFHGYGGRMPDSMKLLTSVPIDNGALELWEKV